jgi:hypothetical protein
MRVQASDVLGDLLRKKEEQQAEAGVAKARGRAPEVPSLVNLFHVGQLVRCSVTDLQDREAAPRGGRRSYSRQDLCCCPPPEFYLPGHMHMCSCHSWLEVPASQWQLQAQSSLIAGLNRLPLRPSLNLAYHSEFSSLLVSSGYLSNMDCANSGAGGQAGKKRIVLSLHVAKVNARLAPEALAAGLQLPACVRSVEDHGFLLDVGVQVGLNHESSHACARAKYERRCDQSEALMHGRGQNIKGAAISLKQKRTCTQPDKCAGLGAF